MASAGHRGGDRTNQHIMDTVNASGEAFFTHTKLDGHLTLRMAIGQTCTEDRQEFILLSDLLGLSALVELVDRDPTPPETPGSVVGPLHAEGSPFFPIGGSINLDNVEGGQTAYVSGTVKGVDGEPIGSSPMVLDVQPGALEVVVHRDR